jgi:hypothetical protein
MSVKLPIVRHCKRLALKRLTGCKGLKTDSLYFKIKPCWQNQGESIKKGCTPKNQWPKKVHFIAKLTITLTVENLELAYL